MNFVLDTGIFVRGLAHWNKELDTASTDTKFKKVIDIILTNCDTLLISGEILKECRSKKIIPGFAGDRFMSVYLHFKMIIKKSYGKHKIKEIGRSITEKIKSDENFRDTMNDLEDHDKYDEKLLTCAAAGKSDRVVIISADRAWAGKQLKIKTKFRREVTTIIFKHIDDFLENY